MTTVIIIDIVLLIIIFVSAILLNKHLIGAGLAFVLVAIETASGTNGVWEVVSRTMAIFLHCDPCNARWEEKWQEFFVGSIQSICAEQ